MSRLVHMLQRFLETSTLRKRRTVKVVADGILIGVTYLLAFLIRFDWSIPPEYVPRMLATGPLVVVFSLIVFVLMRFYSGLWAYWSLRDLKQLFVGHTVCVAFLLILFDIIGSVGVPRTVFVIYWILGILSLGTLRMMYRILLEMQRVEKEDLKRILLVGAGNSGEMLVRQIKSDPKIHALVVALVDDDPAKLGYSVHGIRVKGSRFDIGRIVKEDAVDEIIIAVPSASSTQMREIVKECQQSGVPYLTVPGAKELMDGKVTLNRVRRVRIGDLLNRDQVDVDMRNAASSIEGSRILVTGASGSIGSELCRQIAGFRPGRLVAIDKDENGLFYLDHALRSTCDIRAIVMDAGNEKKVEAVLREHRPEIVFHAAAYKHVPCMEVSPEEAVVNNVGSTRVMGRAALENGVKRFVQVSTDKAVNPVSVMGASKRLCEMYVQQLSKRNGTKFISVRFGNVIGSQGSVFTLFEEQIQSGGPVTVTDPDMERYFMSIPEACSLVLEAGTRGEGGRIYVLDMGRPIRIVDLAKHMISLSDLIPEKDIAIQIVGPRPGEKMREELWYEDENPVRTDMPKIFVAENHKVFPEDFEERIEELIRLGRDLETKKMKAKIRGLVPEYSGS